MQGSEGVREQEVPQQSANPRDLVMLGGPTIEKVSILLLVLSREKVAFQSHPIIVGVL